MGYPDETRDRARELRGRGLSIREIERELSGPSRMAVWRWISGAHDGPGARVKPATRRRRMDLPEVVGDGPIYPDVDPEDKDEVIRRLRLENDILRGTQEVLKGRALGCSTNREKSELIEWGEQFADEIGDERLDVFLTRLDDEAEPGEEPPRAIELVAHGSRAEQIASQL